MYAMCTGHSPFRGDSVAHVIKRVTQDEPRSIPEQNPEIPAWLSEIISSLLQKKADQRVRSAKDLVAILDQHLAGIHHVSESVSHSAINQQIPNNDPARIDKVPAPKRSSRKLWGNRLLWTAAIFSSAGLVSLFLFAVDSKLFRFVPIMEHDLLPAIGALLAVSVVLAFVGVLVSGNSPQNNNPSIPVLLLYLLFGPFGIVLWLIDRDARERAREKLLPTLRARRQKENVSVQTSDDSQVKHHKPNNR